MVPDFLKRALIGNNKARFTFMKLRLHVHNRKKNSFPRRERQREGKEEKIFWSEGVNRRRTTVGGRQQTSFRESRADKMQAELHRRFAWLNLGSCSTSGICRQDPTFFVIKRD